MILRSLAALLSAIFVWSGLYNSVRKTFGELLLKLSEMHFFDLAEESQMEGFVQRLFDKAKKNKQAKNKNSVDHFTEYGIYILISI